MMRVNPSAAVKFALPVKFALDAVNLKVLGFPGDEMVKEFGFAGVRQKSKCFGMEDPGKKSTISASPANEPSPLTFLLGRGKGPDILPRTGLAMGHPPFGQVTGKSVVSLPIGKTVWL